MVGATTFCLSEGDANHGPRSKADDRMDEITKGLEALGPHLVPNFDSEAGTGYDEFSWRMCDCCNSRLGGSRHEFAVLGEKTA